MAKYDKTKKYWLQLREDWFEEDAIKWLEDQKNGKEYSLFYMKLMLKSIKTNGILIRQVGKMLIPYEPQSIADLTRTEVDTVIVAMELLKKIGLVEILEDGAIYIEQVQKMIGFTTNGAERKALQREKTQLNSIEWTESGQMSTKDKDITKTKTIIKDKDKSEQVATSIKQNLKEILDTENFTDKINKKINLWIEYKAEKKNTYKPTGFKAFLSQVKKAIAEYGEDYVLQRFDYSMAQNYQGVFFENNGNTAKVGTLKKEWGANDDGSGFYG